VTDYLWDVFTMGAYAIIALFVLSIVLAWIRSLGEDDGQWWE
jgi:Na+/H+ antiporter NhaC